MSRKETVTEFKLREKMLAYLRHANKLSPDILEAVTERVYFVDLALDLPQYVIDQSPIICGVDESTSGLGLINGFLIFCGEEPITFTVAADGMIIGIE